MQRLVYLFIALLSVTALNAQTISIEEYVNTFKEIAIKEMIRTGVPASITLAQGIVETESGNSKLVKKSNNHFGIKCKETWTGPSVSHDDDAPGECFRKYENAEQSYVDHSDFLRTRKHYNFLFGLDPADYKAWAHGLKKAGYATNPAYPNMLIKYIEKYNLNDYSLIALGRKKAGEPIYAKADQSTVKENVVNTVVQQPISAPQQASDDVKETIKRPVVNYPAGEFKINETKVVYATKGTSFLAIAKQHNVPLKWLFDFNDLKEAEVLERDQLIYLQRKRRIGANPFHVVAAGETLYDVAQAQGIRLDALMELNQIPSNKQPVPGQQLYLQSPAPTAPKLLTVVNTKEGSELIITK
ncbi:glucosaminidase domain-containing protein [Lacibacter sp. H375]|uniref:glucosaminidase domain-containing protein n=1 Tax=Lacibacter sp. H375 TaxID=3133424 RepID=UPI0030C3072B